MLVDAWTYGYSITVMICLEFLSKRALSVNVLSKVPEVHFSMNQIPWRTLRGTADGEIIKRLHIGCYNPYIIPGVPLLAAISILITEHWTPTIPEILYNIPTLYEPLLMRTTERLPFIRIAEKNWALLRLLIFIQRRYLIYINIVYALMQYSIWGGVLSVNGGAAQCIQSACMCVCVYWSARFSHQSHNCVVHHALLVLISDRLIPLSIWTKAEYFIPIWEEKGSVFFDCKIVLFFVNQILNFCVFDLAVQDEAHISEDFSHFKLIIKI